MIELYYAQTGNSLRAAIALEECGLEHTKHKIDLAQAEHKTPDFLKLNPVGAVPVIVDHNGPNGELVLNQSGAIMLYAAELAGKFIPKEVSKRIEVMRWFITAVTDCANSNAMIVYSTSLMPDKSETNKAWFEDRLINTFRTVAAQLGEHEYLVDELSIADLSLFPVVNMRLDLLQQSADDFDNLLNWYARLKERPAITRAMNYS